MARLLTILFVLLGASLSAKEEIAGLNAYGSFVHSDSVPNALFLISDIENGDLFELRRALRIHDIDTVVLTSPGGSVWEGLSIAGVIFDRGLTTYVPFMTSNEFGCFSACAYMFFAGITREAAGPLGVHQIGSYDVESDERQTAEGETQQITQFTTSERLCCTNPMKDSPHESSMVAGMYEQLVPYKIQDDKLVVIQ